MTPQEVYDLAHAAGMAAGSAPGLDDEFPRGIAWVDVAAGEFAAWLVQTGRGRDLPPPPRNAAWSLPFPVRMRVAVPEFGQSYERAEAYVHAFAGVLKAAGIGCFPQHRWD